MENQMYILFFYDSEMLVAIQPDDETLKKELSHTFPGQHVTQLKHDRGLIVETAIAGQQVYYMIEPEGKMALSANKGAVVRELFTYTGKLVSPIKPKPGQGLYLPVQELSPEFLKLFGMVRIDSNKN